MNEATEKKEVEIENTEENLNMEESLDQVEQAEDVNEAAAESEILDEEIERDNEISELKEEIMRMRAESENIRKRNARELENLRKYSLDKFTKALLPVADSMDKELEANASQSVQMTVEQMIEGTKMTQNVLNKVLIEHGMEIINPEGEKFNPEYHEAMTQIPHPDLAPNTIVDVFQKGYILNGRLIRPAMVVVSK